MSPDRAALPTASSSHDPVELPVSASPAALPAVDVDVVVVSVGRRPNTDDLGLDGSAVSIAERGFVDVDDRCRTGEPGVWSVGDCIATPALARFSSDSAYFITCERSEWPMSSANSLAWSGFSCRNHVAKVRLKS